MKENTAIICFSSNKGGMEIDSIRLAIKLSRHTKITLIAKEEAFIANSKEDYLGCKNIRLETIGFKFLFSLSIIFQVRKIIQRHNIKNVIFFGASELRSLFFAFLGLDINLIVRHGTTKSSPKKDLFHRLIYSKVNYHVGICQHLLKNVRYIIPFGKKTKEKLIYPSFVFNEPAHVREGKLTLLHVGRIAEGKGQLDAIKACKILVENNIDFRFDVVGSFEKSYEKEFMDYYFKCGYKDKINLVGFSSDVLSYLNKADIFIFPSRGEGLSSAFIEALSNNIVCLSYANTSFPELKELGFSFNMVEDRNIKKLTIELLRIVEHLDDEKDKVISNSGLVRQLFSLDKEMESYSEILV